MIKYKTQARVSITTRSFTHSSIFAKERKLGAATIYIEKRKNGIQAHSQALMLLKTVSPLISIDDNQAMILICIKLLLIKNCMQNINIITKN